MEELLHELYVSLKSTFEENLNTNEVRRFKNGEIDVFKTYLCLSKTQRDFRKLIESGAVPIEELVSNRHLRNLIYEAVDQETIRKGSAINSDRVFIGANGLYQYYNIMGFDLIEIFKAYDNVRFNQEKLKLKTQEKIWCVFLILFDAGSEENALDTRNIDQEKLSQYFEFFKLIEEQLIENKLNFGKAVGWGTGKDISFRKFITNNVDLPNTGIYNDRPTSTYWLDLSKKKNVQYLLDLIFDTYSAEERVVAYISFIDSLRLLSDKILTELNEIPPELNSTLIEELRS